MKIKVYQKFCTLLFILILLTGCNFIKHKDIPLNNDDVTQEKSMQTTAKLTIVGDFLFEQPFYDDIEENGNGDAYFKRVKTKYFQTDDLTIGNMEVPIGTSDMKVSGEGFNFSAPESIGELLSRQSLEVLGTANNHTYDRGVKGIDSTINFFKDKTNIVTIGTYLDEYDRNKPRIIEKNNIKFGFLAYTYGTNISVPVEYRNKVGFFRDPNSGEVSVEYKNILTEEINALRDKVDVLIVLMHWGIEFTYNPNKQQKEMAKYLNSLNVDIVIGSHSHCMQPIEWITGEHQTLVYYSMGNFVSADDDISRTSPGNEEFDNAYQIGILSTLDVEKENDMINIKNVKTEPIVNYFDKNIRHFELIPMSEYLDEYEKKHYRYSLGFNKDWITNTFNKVIAEDFR